MADPADMTDPRGTAPGTHLLDGPFSPETFRQIYVSLSLPTREFLIIGVTSAIRGEGRTTVSVGLAQTLAADLQVPVYLVEADLERPALARHFAIASAPGLAELLRGELPLANVCQRVGENLLVVTSGRVGDDAPRLLHQIATQDPLHAPPTISGVVVADLPPTVNQSYGLMVAKMTDVLVLVVRAGVTPADVVREAITSLKDGPLRGVVLNGTRR